VSTRPTLDPGAGGGGSGDDDAAIVEDRDGDGFSFGDAAEIWTESIPFVAQLRAADSVDQAVTGVTEGDADPSDALDSVDFAAGSGGTTDATTDAVSDSVDSVTGDAADAASDAAERARNIGPDWLDEAVTVGLAVVVVGAALFLLRPVLSIGAGVAN
jgi:hypothetical protein